MLAVMPLLYACYMLAICLLMCWLLSKVDSYGRMSWRHIRAYVGRHIYILHTEQEQEQARLMMGWAQMQNADYDTQNTRGGSIYCHLCYVCNERTHLLTLHVLYLPMYLLVPLQLID